MSSSSSPSSSTSTRSSTTTPPLVGFFTYPNGLPDSRGRTLSEILSWGNDKLEYSHDYIQIVFPLPERSGVNWNAPLIDRATFVAFRTQPALRARLREAFERMMAFYGFGIEEKKKKVAKSEDGDSGKGRTAVLTRLPEFEERAGDSWLTRFDHNHLRITRIIRSLRVLGLETEAKAFYEALVDVVKERPGRVSGTSVMYWGRAMERPLNVKPDEDRVEEKAGPLFLREYEKGVLTELVKTSPSHVNVASSSEDKGSPTQDTTAKVEEPNPDSREEAPSNSTDMQRSKSP
ncbi:uncharacterized protein STEHIDRAFT_100890 [Stereum hirsutum FP-91666 SS1]|uniref:uncharacterized protein n=1 Tax=Stereum hirsutum (strain FP-91666) TaxID=721885 RepID=UPI000444A29B|nr:uncharacterized protein STEHIDRAFT_100890 [Stereum hirsutum FP-91666 SS1]EIM83871.1 hypothetical protein STEHIDRAFT_100890 [Stereum hirsutum FP-91666 SS1]